MKKIFALLLTLAMVLSLAACGGGSNAGTDDKASGNEGAATPLPPAASTT